MLGDSRDLPASVVHELAAYMEANNIASLTAHRHYDKAVTVRKLKLELKLFREVPIT